MKMNRRNVLLGLGTAAAGSGAVFGSGAFSTVEANRDVKINIAADNNAALGIEPTTNATFLDDSGDAVFFDFTSGAEGTFDGINDGARISFGAEFILTNNGPNPVRVIIDEQQLEEDTGGKVGFFPAVGAISSIDSGGTLTLGAGENGDEGLGPGDSNDGITLEPGAVLPVSGEFNTNAAELTETNSDITIFAVGDNDERYNTAGPGSYIKDGDSSIPVYGADGSVGEGSTFDLLTGDSVTVDEVYTEGTDPALST